MPLTAPPASRVLIVDDHPWFRGAARTLLHSGGFEVVGEAATITEGLRAIQAVRPDLVMLDIHLPDGDGIDCAATIAQLADPPAVVLVSAREAVEFGARLTASTACGFIPKDDLSVASLRALLEGCSAG
jgi:DNA-binding NarL/FixJ family response regulator